MEAAPARRRYYGATHAPRHQCGASRAAVPLQAVVSSGDSSMPAWHGTCSCIASSRAPPRTVLSPSSRAQPFNSGDFFMAAGDVFKTIKENEVKFVDLRFTDTKGKEQHVTVPTKMFDADKFKDGHAFDGSSIAGWKGIEASDMLLMPDPDSARM